MNEFIEHLIQIAILNNVSSDSPYMMQFEQRYWVVVSYGEPSIIMPLNVVWIEGDPSSIDYKVARKRSAKVADGDFNNTWLTIADLDTLKETQVWDSDDLPTGVFSPVHANSGQLTFPVVPRTGPYGTDEVIPKSEVSSLISSATTSIFSMYGSLNSRVNINKRDILELKTNMPDAEFYRLISDMVTQVTSNTEKIDLAPTVYSVDVDNQQTVNMQLDGSKSIAHAVLRTEEGAMILPENVVLLYDEAQDQTEIIVVFVYPVSGELTLIG